MCQRAECWPAAGWLPGPRAADTDTDIGTELAAVAEPVAAGVVAVAEVRVAVRSAPAISPGQVGTIEPTEPGPPQVLPPRVLPPAAGSKQGWHMVPVRMSVQPSSPEHTLRARKGGMRTQCSKRHHSACCCSHRR